MHAYRHTSCNTHCVCTLTHILSISSRSLRAFGKSTLLPRTRTCKDNRVQNWWYGNTDKDYRKISTFQNWHCEVTCTQTSNFANGQLIQNLSSNFYSPGQYSSWYVKSLSLGHIDQVLYSSLFLLLSYINHNRLDSQFTYYTWHCTCTCTETCTTYMYITTIGMHSNSRGPTTPAALYTSLSTSLSTQSCNEYQNAHNKWSCDLVCLSLFTQNMNTHWDSRQLRLVQ